MRRRRYPQELFDRAVEIARETSQHNASRATGLSRTAIRAEMRRRKVAIRAPGNYTRGEAEALACKMVF